MAEEVLTPTEVLEIVYNSYKSLNDSSSDNASSSDNEIDDTAVADAIRMMTVVMTRKYCTKILGGRLWTITRDTEKCSVVILDPEMVQKM